MKTLRKDGANEECSEQVKMLLYIYRKTLNHFGDPMWWPGEGAWEIAVGAILTQNTSWTNVEKAISRMKSLGIFTPEEIMRSEERSIAHAIRPSGYYNQKAKKLRFLAAWVLREFDGDLKKARERDLKSLQKEILNLWGVGQETADSILLYALDLPVFVVDRYTIRILTRFGLPLSPNYEKAVSEVKNLVEGWNKNVQFLNRLHALFVLTGKEYCKTRPFCDRCPLREKCHTAKSLLEEGF